MSEMQEHASVPELTRGWRLRMALEHAEISVEEIADDLGISRSTASRWVHDRGPVRDIYLKQWALRCGVPFDWIKTGDASDPTNHGSTDRYLAGSASPAFGSDDLAYAA